jgi:hypothetical protein
LKVPDVATLIFPVVIATTPSQTPQPPQKRISQ